MNIDRHLADEDILAEIGNRIAKLRLDLDLTQAQLARDAGLSVSTVQRLEAGSVSSQLATLIRVARVLKFIDHFDLIVPISELGPIDRLDRKGKDRQRASGSRKSGKPPTKPWTWGEE